MAKAKKSEQSGNVVLSPASNVVDLPVSLIDADPEWNARSVVEIVDKTGNLAESIKREGQQTPVIVRAIPGGRYKLLAGFRRLAAVSWPEKKGGLNRDTIRATIVPPAKDEKDQELNDLIANLTENVQRKDLTPYDLAMRAHALHDEYDLSAAKLATRLGKSESYVDSLIRVVANLHPTILKRWQEEHGPNPPANKVLATDWLSKQARSSVTHEEQLAAFQVLMGTTPADADAAARGARPPGSGPTAPTRQTASAIDKAVAAAKQVKADGEHEDERYLQGVLDTLAWVTGARKSIPSVYTPAPKPAKADAS